MKVMKKQNSQKLSLIQAEVEVQLEDEWGTSDDMYFFLHFLWQSLKYLGV